jgi:hypothetical protein
MADQITVGSNTKNELIIAAVQKNLLERSTIASFVRDVSAFAIKGATAVEIPKLTNFNVTNRAFGAAVDSQKLDDSVDEIRFNKNAYISWSVDARSVYQSSIDWQIEQALRASAAHAKYVDEQVIDVAVNVAGSEIAISDAKTEILEMRAFILGNGGEIGKMSLWISPAKEAEMLAVQDFIRADYTGAAAVRNGEIGRLYGVPVIISRLLGDEFSRPEMIMCDSDGIGLGFQEGVQFSEQNENSLGALSKRYAMDQLFGTAGLLLGEEGVSATKSPLVAKLAIATP